MKYLTLIFAAILLINFVQALTLSHKEVEDGDCSRMELHTWPNINFFEILREVLISALYIPMSSKNFAYHLRTQLTGTDSLPEESLIKMCLRINRHTEIVAHTDSTKILLKCNYTTTEDNIGCYSTATDPHSHMSGKIRVTIVWVDKNSHNFLLALCGMRSQKSYWFLASTSASVNSQVEEEVLSKLTNLGFDKNSVLHHDYTQCESEKSKLSKVLKLG